MLQSMIAGQENVREGVRSGYIQGKRRGDHKGNARERKVKGGGRSEEPTPAGELKEEEVMHLVSFIALLLVEPREGGMST